jgi:hypothetical protein
MVFKKKSDLVIFEPPCIFMEHSEEIALDTADHKLTRLQQFLHHLNSIRPTIKFTCGVEANDTLPFLEVLVLKRGPKLAMKVCQKPNHKLLQQ